MSKAKTAMSFPDLHDVAIQYEWSNQNYFYTLQFFYSVVNFINEQRKIEGLDQITPPALKMVWKYCPNLSSNGNSKSQKINFFEDRLIKNDETKVFPFAFSHPMVIFNNL